MILAPEVAAQSGDEQEFKMYNLILLYLLNAKQLSPTDKAIKYQLMSQLLSANEIATGEHNA